MKITITRPQHVKAAGLCQAKEKTRYYLCGINIERAPQGGLYIVGTNGHVMSVGYDANGEIEGADSVILKFPDDFLRSIKATTRNKLAIENNLACIVTESTPECKTPTAELLRLPGPFPKWHSLIPKLQGTQCPGVVATKYLTLVDQIQRCYHSGRKLRGARIVGAEDKDPLAARPHIVTLIGVSDWAGAIMSLRVLDTSKLAVPNWLPAK